MIKNISFVLSFTILGLFFGAGINAEAQNDAPDLQEQAVDGYFGGYYTDICTMNPYDQSCFTGINYGYGGGYGNYGYDGGYGYGGYGYGGRGGYGYGNRGGYGYGNRGSYGYGNRSGFGEGGRNSGRGGNSHGGSGNRSGGGHR